MACNHSLHYLHLSSYFLWKDVDAIVPDSAENMEHVPLSIRSSAGFLSFITAWMPNSGMHEPFRSILDQQKPSLAFC